MPDTINSTRIVSLSGLPGNGRMFENVHRVSRPMAPERCTGVTDHSFPARE
jgi:hypothetical protein